MNILTELSHISPELILLIGACATMMVRLFARCPQVAAYHAAQVTCLLSLIAVLSLGLNVDSGPVFSGLLEIDGLAIFMKGFMLVGLIAIFSYGRAYVAHSLATVGEYYILALFALLGMFVSVSSVNLLMVFLGLEVMSLPIYALVALWREEERCVEAGLKYFITGAIATCFLLYGMSLLFGATASLAFVDIKAYLTTHVLQHDWLMLAAVVFLTCGFAFKLGVVPFHMWVPDVYDGAPTPVTLLIATLPKLTVFIVLLRLFAFALAPMALVWSKIMLGFALLSIAVGNIMALSQTQMKRLLAYSSVAHMGYLLLAISLHSQAGYSAALFYMLVYTLASGVMFAILMAYQFKQNALDAIDSLQGLAQYAPMAGFFAVVALFSMAGVPPILGFIAKMWVFNLLVQANWLSVAIYAVLFTLLGAFYYIKVVQALYFQAPDKSYHRCIGNNLSLIHI